MASANVLTQESALPESSRPKVVVQRNQAVDAYRGFVMLLMMGEVMSFAEVAKAHPGNWFWSLLGYHQSHVEWAGCSLHDMIQPSFSFLVGVALPYSIASRQAKGQEPGKLFLHALWRSFLLVALGVLLRSLSSPIINYTFEDTLSQIGLGYPILFLLGWFAKERKQWIALAVVLVGYWAAWALYPAPGTNFNWAAVGVPADWNLAHNFSGFAAHWNKNSNLGNAFDQWFLNLFPRVKPFIDNDGGYLTLSFIPTLGTMILGLIAGEWTRTIEPRKVIRQYLLAAVALIALGLALHFTGICPIVKRIWTPAWTLFSGGVAFAFLAVFTWLIEVQNWRKWAFPLVVVGMNSIAAYLIAHLLEGMIRKVITTHIGVLQPPYEGVLMMIVFWLILYWLYRTKTFIRI
jgi:heparan-alpha-glucosaminide N-acetyltransferase